MAYIPQGSVLAVFFDTAVTGLDEDMEDVLLDAMGKAKLKALKNVSGHRIHFQGNLDNLENQDENKT